VKWPSKIRCFVSRFVSRVFSWFRLVGSCGIPSIGSLSQKVMVDDWMVTGVSPF
jgi:hypothetical protein